MRPLVKTLAIALIATAFASQPVMVLAADAPEPADLQKISKNSKGDGTHTYYRGGSSPAKWSTPTRASSNRMAGRS